MAYVPVPKDLTKVKTKVALNLTKRQLIFFSLAAVVGVPLYLLAKKPLGSSVSAILMVTVMLPFFFMAMYERDGQPAEKILKNMIRHRLWPETRPYKTRNFYKIMSKKEEISIAKNQTAGSAGKAPAGKHPAGAKKPVRSKKGR